MNGNVSMCMEILRRIRFVIIILVVGYLFHPVAYASEKAATLEVIGTGRVMVDPNVALLAFAVETNARGAGEAVAANAERTQKLIRTLKGVMGPKDTIKASNFDLSPVYSKTDLFRPEGYRVSNRVILETRTLDRVGRLIDAAVAANVSRINSLQFQNDQHEVNQKMASKAAVKYALVSARELAKAADLDLRRIVTISFTGHEPVSRPYMAEAAFARSQTPIEVGQIPVVARVRVVFEVE